MNDLHAVRRCIRCGAPLQEEDPSKEGYLSEDIKAKEGPEPLLCGSCYEEARWNERPALGSVTADFLKLLAKAKEEKALIVYLVDLFSFECGFIPEISKAIRGLPILVLANKRDLLPPDIDEGALRNYVAHRFHVAGLENVSEKDVFLTSVSFQTGSLAAASEIECRREGKNVYLIGAEKSGKSLFLDVFLSNYRNDSGRVITTAAYPGTSLVTMMIPLDKSHTLYDTPGTSLQNSFYGRPDTPKEIVIRFGETPLGSKMTLESGSSLFLGLLARYEFFGKSRKRLPIVTYFAKTLVLKKVAPHKEMDALFDKYLEKKALRPRMANLHSSLDFDAFEFVFQKAERRDFGIAGLGWITFEGEEGDKVRVYVPKGIGVYSSRPKITPKPKEKK